MIMKSPLQGMNNFTGLLVCCYTGGTLGCEDYPLPERTAVVQPKASARYLIANLLRSKIVL